MILNTIKKMIEEGYSIYNVYYLADKNTKERCYKLNFEEHQIVISNDIKSFGEDDLIMDLGDLYLELLLHKDKMPSSIVSRKDSKELVYVGFFIDEKKGEVIFSWHADSLQHHF